MGYRPPDPRSPCPQLNLLKPPIPEQSSWIRHWSEPICPVFWKEREGFQCERRHSSTHSGPRHQTGVSGQLIATCSVHVISLNTVVCRKAGSMGRCSRRNERTIRKINKTIHPRDKESPRPVCYERNDGCRTLRPGPYPEANLQGRCVRTVGGIVNGKALL